MVFETLKLVQEGGVLLAADRGRHPYVQKTNVRFPAEGGIEISACLFVFPLMRVWTGISDFVFRGKAKQMLAITGNKRTWPDPTCLDCVTTSL